MIIHPHLRNWQILISILDGVAVLSLMIRCAEAIDAEKLKRAVGDSAGISTILLCRYVIPNVMMLNGD